MSKSTAVSAPGKVLLAGGYLVLDRKYTGLVFGLAARIHTVVRELPTRDGVSLSEIIVRSPQFTDAEWRYGYRLADNGNGIEVTQLKGSSTATLSRNAFVETALRYALTYVGSMSSPDISPSAITILADDDYYSQASPRSESSSPFTNFHVRLEDAHKTGLGSSAALVTSLVGGLLAYYLPADQFDVRSEKGKAIVHNLAQAAHCAAQGKIGSGFDVAAAVYGSCVYRRFSPSVLERLGPGDKFAQNLSDTVNDRFSSWDAEVIKGVSVLPGCRLVMCDIDVGSQTVAMVKKVLEWRKESPRQAGELWNKLDEANTSLRVLLGELDKLHSEQHEVYHAGLGLVASATPSQSMQTNNLRSVWGGNYFNIRSTFARIRALNSDMSNASGVPIEPTSQTRLIDSCTNEIPGVIGGVVPGAGGYDALVLMVVDQEQVLASLDEHLRNWTLNQTSDDGIIIRQVRTLSVKQDKHGVQLEEDSGMLNAYISWLQ